jgi:hypothetical protein
MPDCRQHNHRLNLRLLPQQRSDPTVIFINRAFLFSGLRLSLTLNGACLQIRDKWLKTPFKQDHR